MPGVEPFLANILLAPQHLATEAQAINGTTPTKIFFMNTSMMAPAVIGLTCNHRPLVPQGQQMFKRRPGV